MKVFQDMFEDVRYVPQVNLAIKSWVCILHFRFLLVLGKGISMDFVGGLPMSRRNHDCLYVVVDQFRKMYILMPCTKKVTNEQMAQMFGCILDFLNPLFLIGILDLLEVFGRVYGHSWTPK
jgi:hypothetical protein